MPRFAHWATRVGWRASVSALLALAYVQPLHAQGQIVVDELEVRLGSRPGSRRTESFRVTNVGTTAAQATITLADWDRSESGENRYFDHGSLASSCRNHVKAFPMVVRVEPKSSQDIRVTVDSTQSLPPSCYAMLFVEQPPAPASAKGVAIQYTVRFGVKVYVEPDPAPPTGEIEDFHIARGDSLQRAGSRLAATIRYRNTAERQTTVRGTVEIRRTDNSLLATLPIAEFPVLPGARRRVALDLPALPSGRYVLLALLDHGGAEIVAAQSELTVP